MTTRDTDWDGVRLHVVTGKGGTGKTTVAAAMALALASAGRKVLLIEVEGRQGIARLFDCPPLPYEERKVAIGLGAQGAGQGGDVYALAVDPEGALLDYLEMFYNLRRTGKALTRLGVVDFATTIAPGLSDVLVTGKATEAARRRVGRRDDSHVYHAVVMDAPPTGRISRFLDVSTEVSGLAKVGPIRTHADTVARVIRSPQTAVHFVTTLEEMPVQETLDGIAELHELTGDAIRPGGIFINMARPAMLDAPTWPRRPAASLDVTELALGLKAAGISDNHGLAADLMTELREHAQQVALQDRERDELLTSGPPALRAADDPRGDRPGQPVPAGRRAQGAGGGMTVAPALDMDRIIDDRRTRIIVCCGSGGVGKTTAAAAIGLRAAERGRQACVLTVDPARRLAQSMGLTSLDNTPREVDGVDTADGGSLHAMMLDMKRTFDEIVEAHADPDRAAQILANPFYQSLSSSFAGTQEYMAMEKLGQLRHADEWDLIVVDTPPSRSALDFLDAPQRLGRFLDGRLIRLLTVPAKAGMSYMKVLNAGFAMMTSALTKILGAQVLKDAQTFVTAFDTMFGGFRERAEGTYRLLQAPGTAFLVVAAPEPDALREASYFVERLDAERMPLAGLILNRVHTSPAGRLSAARSLAAAETLEMQDKPNGSGSDAPRYSIAVAALRMHAERMQLSKRERRLAEHFTSAHPAIPVAEVIAQPEDVHDLDGLRVIGTILSRQGR